MKIGIILYSQTGHTLSVVKELNDSLKKKKYDVTIMEIKANRDLKNPQVFTLTDAPKVDEFDVIVFASYVEAFMLCSVMSKYLSDLSDLSNKKIITLVTHHLVPKWLGGNAAIKKMAKIINSKSGKVSQSYIISWSSKEREQQIKDSVVDIVKYINQESK